MRCFEIRRRVASSPEISLLNNNMRCFEIHARQTIELSAVQVK